MRTMQVTSLIAGLLFSTSIFAADASKPPLPPSATPGQGFTQEGLKRIDGFFADQIAANNMAGAVLAVAKNGKLTIFKPYGYLDKASGKPMTTDAIFNLASMTKVMASVSALTFYEEGKLELASQI
jgi:CubicO group peptidase (beta-lactamase class C family)